jgi:hypothetical protein
LAVCVEWGGGGGGRRNSRGWMSGGRLHANLCACHPLFPLGKC